MSVWYEDDSPQADTSYRRGTVFGLTLAEVFILLLFLLLMLFATADDETDTAERTAKALEQAEKELEELTPYREVVRTFSAPEEIVTLREARDDALRDADQRRIEAEELREEAKTAQQEIETLRDVVANSEGAAEETVSQLVEARKEAAEAREELHLLRTKGENPPCWYQTVPDGKGGSRESPRYALAVGIRDDDVVLRALAPPPGGSEEGGTYAQEHARLRLSELPYGRALSDREFRNAMRPLRDAGENEQVRSYRCIFWVKVWDLTAQDAKKRWQYAHDRLIEGYFGTYTVRDEPWPGFN